MMILRHTYRDKKKRWTYKVIKWDIKFINTQYSRNKPQKLFRTSIQWADDTFSPSSFYFLCPRKRGRSGKFEEDQ